MSFWNWLKRKPLNFEEVFGPPFSDAAQQFYTTRFPHQSSYRSFDVQLPEETRQEFEPLLEHVESFQFFTRPFKVSDHWILGYHMEQDTSTIIVNQDYQILLEDLDQEGNREEHFLVEHFQDFLNMLVLDGDE